MLLASCSYCGTLTVEYEHVNTKEQKEWVRLMVERPVNRSLFSPSEKRLILRRLLYTGDRRTLIIVPSLRMFRKAQGVRLLRVGRG